MDKDNILLEHIEANSKAVENIVYDIVKKYTSELDDIVKEAKTWFNDIETLTDIELQSLLLQLPSAMYFVGESQEYIGLREDVAKMAKMEKYNEVRKVATGTVQDKNTMAEIESLEEALNQVIYHRAYKMIKVKIEVAYELLNSLKKVNERRVMEFKTGGLM